MHPALGGIQLRALGLQSNEFRTEPVKAAIRRLRPACPQLRCYIGADDSDTEA